MTKSLLLSDFLDSLFHKDFPLRMTTACCIRLVVILFIFVATANCYDIYCYYNASARDRPEPMEYHFQDIPTKLCTHVILRGDMFLRPSNVDADSHLVYRWFFKNSVEHVYEGQFRLMHQMYQISV